MLTLFEPASRAVIAAREPPSRIVKNMYTENQAALSGTGAAPTARRAFTLLELLVVMGVIALLSVLVIPAVGSLSTARKAASSVAELARGLEQARGEALARKTYVWFVAKNGTGSDTRDGVWFSLFASADGSPGTATANLVPLGASRFLAGARLVALDSVEAEIRDSLPAGTADATETAALAVSSGPVNYAGGSHALVFAPSGELLLAANPSPATPYSPSAALSVSTWNGNRRIDALDAVLQIAGGSGRVRVLRQ